MAAEMAVVPLRGPGYRPTACEGWEIQLLTVRYPAAAGQDNRIWRPLGGYLPVTGWQTVRRYCIIYRWIKLCSRVYLY